MTLLPDQRRVIDEILADAAAGATKTADQIDLAMIEVNDLAGSGHEWVESYLRDLMRLGMAKELADWRRARRRSARTAKGSEVEAPEYAGIRRRDDDGRQEHHQLSLGDLTPDEFEQWLNDQTKARDSMSRKIQWGKDALAIARERQVSRMSPAFAELERRHA